MERPYVFYQLKGEQYRLEFDGKVVFVDKEQWRRFVNVQHGRKADEGISKAGGIGVDQEDLNLLINS